MTSRFPLRVYMLMLILFATIIPAMVASWQFLERRDAEIAGVKQDLIASAQGIAQDLNDAIRATSQLEYGLSRAPELSSNNVKLCSEYLSDVINEYPLYTGFLTIQPNGELFCDSLQTGRHLNLSDREYFKELRDGVGSLSVQPTFGRLTNKAVIQIAYASRTSNNELKHILLASLDLEKFMSSRLKTLARQNAIISVVTDDGVVLTWNPYSKDIIGNKLPASTLLDFVLAHHSNEVRDVIDSNGITRIWAIAELPDFPFNGPHILIGISTVDLMASANKTLSDALMVMILVWAAVFIAAWSLANKMVKYELLEGQRMRSINEQLEKRVIERTEGIAIINKELSREITERSRAEDQLHTLAFYDPLTKLPNRRLLVDTLDKILKNEKIGVNHGGVMFIDLDNFKLINDTLGHEVGDQLLKEVGHRIQHVVRQVDVVSRLSGDEFVVVIRFNSTINGTMPEQTLIDQLEFIAKKINATLLEPFYLDVVSPTGEIQKIPYHSTASIGITLFGKKKSTVDELLQQSDLAMYQAKDIGKNTFCFFDSNMQLAVTNRAELELSIRSALQNEQFRLYYQPVIDSDTNSVVGAEALVRLVGDARATISPIEFISLAEQTGLILPLGEWVIKQACMQLAAWSNNDKMKHLTLAVNVSARQFFQPEFVDYVVRTISETNIDPGKLVLELTESLLVKNVEDIITKMNELKKLGVCFSLDDFGTGYSSLSYLKRMPFDRVKIDQSFIRDILTDHNDASIAKMVVVLGDSLNLDVIAEGVESIKQKEFLEEHGCHIFQGFYFSKPLPIEMFESYIVS